MKIKDILLSWDFLASLPISLVVAYLLPFWVSNEFAHDLYGIGISVLSIVFSVYFAALAIIISSSDDDFVRFLEEEGDYTAIITTFEFSLGALFIALLYSLIMYAFTAAWIAHKFESQQYWWLAIFTFLFLYSLFAALNSTMDSITYAKFRTKYLKKKPKGASGV
jgi:hypothetical protein